MHYSYIVGSHYYYKKEILAIIDRVDIQRRMARTVQAQLKPGKEPTLTTTFKEDLLKFLETEIL